MDLEEQMSDIIYKYGPWTAHNIEISPGLFTIKPSSSDQAYKRAQLYSTLIKTFLRRKIEGCRILDLGCLEGGISLELARNGASCVGIDVRASHLAKADFAAKAIGVSDKCKWIEADITESDTWSNIKKFDVVICSGLLYHIDGPDLLTLLCNMQNICNESGLTIIDTNITTKTDQTLKITDQLTIHGTHWQEHNSSDTDQIRLNSSWSSYKNDRAFWLTERSLTNILVTAGYGTVFKPLYPYHEWSHQSRDIWLALPNPANTNITPLRIDPDPRPLDHPGLK